MRSRATDLTVPPCRIRCCCVTWWLKIRFSWKEDAFSFLDHLPFTRRLYSSFFLVSPKSDFATIQRVDRKKEKKFYQGATHWKSHRFLLVDYSVISHEFPSRQENQDISKETDILRNRSIACLCRYWLRVKLRVTELKLKVLISKFERVLKL